MSESRAPFAESSGAEKCPVCEDDGWIDINDEDGFPIGARDCPRLGEPGHAPFNASGLLSLPEGS